MTKIQLLVFLTNEKNSQFHKSNSSNRVILIDTVTKRASLSVQSNRSICSGSEQPRLCGMEQNVQYTEIIKLGMASQFLQRH